jgi:hypothetical protein
MLADRSRPLEPDQPLQLRVHAVEPGDSWGRANEYGKECGRGAEQTSVQGPPDLAASSVRSLQVGLSDWEDVTGTQWTVATCRGCGASLGGFEDDEEAISTLAGVIKVHGCGQGFSASGGELWGATLVPMRRPSQGAATIPVRALVKLDPARHAKVAALPFGDLVLADIEELNAVVRGQWPNATLAMWGRVLDGLIKARLIDENAWKPAWDSESLGGLLGKQAPADEIDLRVKPALRGRLQDKVAYLRNAGPHQKYTQVSMIEAHGAVSVLNDFIDAWLA